MAVTAVICPLLLTVIAGTYVELPYDPAVTPESVMYIPFVLDVSPPPEPATTLITCPEPPKLIPLPALYGLLSCAIHLEEPPDQVNTCPVPGPGKLVSLRSVRFITFKITLPSLPST